MINMGHCRFENTALAMEECLDALRYQTKDELSPSERSYAARLHELATEYIEEYKMLYG